MDERIIGRRRRRTRGEHEVEDRDEEATKDMRRGARTRRRDEG